MFAQSRIFTIVLSVSILFGATLPAASYLRLGGIAGDSRDPKHSGWIEIISFDQDHHRWTHREGAISLLPKESIKEEGGTMTVTRFVRNAIPDLYTACVNGTYIGQVAVDVPLDPDNDKKIAKLVLSDVVITDVNLKRPKSPKALPLEQITMNFQSAKWDVPSSDEAKGAQGSDR